MSTPDSTDISEAEWQARREVAAALEPLDDAGRVRVVVALAERFGFDLAELSGGSDDEAGGGSGGQADGFGA